MFIFRTKNVFELLLQAQRLAKMYSEWNNLLVGLHAGITLRIPHIFVERRLVNWWPVGNNVAGLAVETHATHTPTPVDSIECLPTCQIPEMVPVIMNVVLAPP
jgi:hypothetical protein